MTPQTVPATRVSALRDQLDVLSTATHHPVPEPMEKLGHDHGLVHYRHRLAGPSGPATLTVDGIRDPAQIFLGGRLVGVLERDNPSPTLELDVPEGGAELEILVEPFRRVNCGPHLADRKGLVAGVRLDHQHLCGWDIRVLPLDDLTVLPTAPAAAPVEGPAFDRAVVELPEPGDAFLAVPGSDRTLVWVNGFLLGRLWIERGPSGPSTPRRRCGGRAATRFWCWTSPVPTRPTPRSSSSCAPSPTSALSRRHRGTDPARAAGSLPMR